MTRDSLNSGDVFILETKTKIFHWNGKKSSRPERTKGVDISHRVNRTYGSRLEIIQMDEGKNDDEPEFWKQLGGKGPVKARADWIYSVCRCLADTLYPCRRSLPAATTATLRRRRTTATSCTG